MNEVTSMKNNEQDHISPKVKWSSDLSYTLLLNCALLATPIATYLQPDIEHNIIFLNLGPACGLILLVKAYTDKGLTRSQRVQYWITLALSIFISIATFAIQIAIALTGAMR